MFEDDTTNPRGEGLPLQLWAKSRRREPTMPMLRAESEQVLAYAKTEAGKRVTGRLVRYNSTMENRKTMDRELHRRAPAVSRADTQMRNFIDEHLGPDGRIICYGGKTRFRMQEFYCRSRPRGPKNRKVPKKFQGNVIRLAWAVEVLCQQLELWECEEGESILGIITSGWRAVDYNRRVGGAPASRHLTGRACDAVFRRVSPVDSRRLTLSPKRVFRCVRRLQRMRSTDLWGVGLYRGWVHLDTDGSEGRPRVWRTRWSEKRKNR